MDPEQMSKEELVNQIKEMKSYMDNVVVFWGGKKELWDTFHQVAENASGDYTEKEAENASVIINTPGAFDEFIELVRDSFDRGGISYVLSEKISALMEEAASRYKREH